MNINKQALELVGVTVDEYLFWCKENKRPSYKEETKQDFFKRIREGKIVKDVRNQRLINKKPRKDKSENGQEDEN